MSNFRPTRTCPHRLCQPLHLSFVVVGLVVLLGLSSTQPWLIGIALVGLLFSLGIYQLVHGQGLVATAREEAADTVAVTVRAGWTRAAVALDVVYTLTFLAVAVGVFQTRSSGSWDAPTTGLDWVWLVVGGCVFTLAHEVLHRRSVRITKTPQEATS
jgi:hypothetical protein